MMEERQTVLRGELALLLAVVINSFGVVLMLRSGSGISAISSVPYAFSELFPRVLHGDPGPYIFQGLLVLSLMVLRKRFVPEYLFSFVVGFFFGIMIDFHELWISWLPQTLPLRVLYFCISYLSSCFRHPPCSNRCRMPIIPTDLFPRELAEITGTAYSRIKISFDVICLLTTAVLTFFGLGRIMGLGVGTVLAAFTMGKCIGLIGGWMDRRVSFVSILSRRQAAAAEEG